MIGHRSSILVLFLILSCLASIGCAGGGDSASGTGTEIAVAAISGAGNASESMIAADARWLSPARATGQRPRWSLLAEAWAVPSCDWSDLVSSCQNNASTITFGGCSSPSNPAIQIRGSETFAWTGEGCCTLRPGEASSATPCVFSRRTVDVDGAADPLIRSLGSHSVTLNTEDVSGYQQPRTGGFVVTCQGANGDLTCNGQRQVAITGAHYRGHSGRADWDHTVSTDEPLIIQGQGAARRVVSGKVRVQHNIAEYTTVTTIVEPLVHQWGCCLPVGGKVITAFFGGKRDGKTEVLSFGPKCGESTLEDLDHKRTGLLLRHCL